MKAKLQTVLLALVFAIPFGGVGAGATYGIYYALSESHRARDWVVVQAKVEEADLRASRGSKGGTTYSAEGAYRYAFGGRDYTSRQLGFSFVGGSDNVGNWQENMADFLRDAKASGQTIPVFVNPEDPKEAVVDRDVRWGMIAFMGIFAVMFGGVGVGAFIAIGVTLFGKSRPARPPRKAPEPAPKPKPRFAGEAPPAAPSPPPLNPQFDQALQGLFGARATQLTDEHRMTLSQMDPKHQELAGKLITYAPKIKKAVFVVVIAFIALQVVGVLIAVLANVAS